MKNTFVKALALALALVTLTCVFASCGTRLSGTYSATAAGTGTVFEFKGSKVLITFKVVGFSGDPIEAKYEIKDDKIKFIFDEDSSEANNLKGELPFEKGDDYIKIAGIKYTKE